MTATLRLSQNSAADALLSRSPFALLVGMLLDQQIPMEKAFMGPYVLSERLGRELDPADVASQDPAQFAAVMAGPPAVHRFPGAMAQRVQALAASIVDRHDGDAAEVWQGAADGQDLLARLVALPGFGPPKARIFVALLGKQLGVTPPGWREAAGEYGADGGHRSVADITGPASLAAVRADKKERKAAHKAQQTEQMQQAPKATAGQKARQPRQPRPGVR